MLRNKKKMEASPNPIHRQAGIRKATTRKASALQASLRKSVRYTSPLVEAEHAYTPEPSTSPAPESPPVKETNAEFWINCHETRPGNISSLYPRYFGNVHVNEKVILVPVRRPDGGPKWNCYYKRVTPEMTDSVGPINGKDLHRTRLPVGLQLHDIKNSDERARFETKKTISESTVDLVKGFDIEQEMWLLQGLQDSKFSRFLDLNKVQAAMEEEQLSFGDEDSIRDIYVNGAVHYPADADNPDQFDAYTVMENLYRAAESTRGDIKTIDDEKEEVLSHMVYHRELARERRVRKLVDDIEAVEKMWKTTTVSRYRSIATIRRAFDYLCNLQSLKYPWPCSHAFFEATLDMIRAKEEYCMLAFKEDTQRFLCLLRKAMDDTEIRRMKGWLEARTHAQYFDLLGPGLAPNFNDELLDAPNS